MYQRSRTDSANTNRWRTIQKSSRTVVAYETLPERAPEKYGELERVDFVSRVASTREFRDPTKITLVPFALAAVFAARGPVGADETKQTGEAPAAKKWRWKS